jgi:hypothetical protein
MTLSRLLWLAPLIASAAVYTDGPLPLYDGRRVLARIVAPDHPSTLETLAVGKLTRAARDVFGFDLPVVSARDAQDLAGSIVIGTPASNPMLLQLDLPDGDGFLVQRLAETREPALVLAARTPRGVLNGASYLADFAMQAHAGLVAMQTQTVRRQSPIEQRGTYNLVCWGLTPRYTRQDWEHILDAMADDGMNVIYFWLSGIFRSRLFPESFIYPETPLTTEDVRQLIRHAHSRGIRFHLGAGVFAWFGIDDIAKYHAEFRDPGVPYMSRTLPTARQAMKSYLMELYDAFPEADGMWLEIGDEGDYACKDPACQKPIDEFGSKVSGQASPDFLKEFSAELWSKHPQSRLVWGMGYPEAHKWDVRYYERLRQDFRDPRYYFLEVRQNWELQDRQGILKPLRDISRHSMHWDQYYGLSMRDIGERAHRVMEDELAGYIVAFEPGFNSHSVFGRRVPYPVDVIPYRLTRFAYREFTWDPNLSWSGYKKKLLDAFFGEGADPELFDLTYTLFEFMRTGPISGSFRELTHPVDGSAYGKLLKPRLAAIEARLSSLEPQLGPRAKTVGLPLLRRAIADLREGYSVQ